MRDRPGRKMALSCRSLTQGLPVLAVRIGIVAIAVATAALLAVRWDDWLGARVAQTTEDAYVKGDITPLGAKVEGYILKVAVRDFQHVKKGDLLVETEDDDYKARRAQAEAALAGAETAIANINRTRRGNTPRSPKPRAPSRQPRRTSSAPPSKPSASAP